MTTIYETGPEADPAEALYDRIFSTAPPLPVDALDISAIREMVTEEPPTAPGYAWERVTAWLADVRNARNSGDGPILIVDLCSSLPFLAARGRAGEFARSLTKARGMVYDTLLSGAGIEQSRAEAEEFGAISKLLVSRESQRRQITAAIQETIYGMTIAQWENEDVLRAALAEKIALQRNHYTQEKKRDDDDTEAGWGVRFTTETEEQSILEIISSFQVPTPEAGPAGKELKEDEWYQMQQAIARDRSQDKEARRMARTLLNWDANYLILMGQAQSRRAVGDELAHRYIDWYAGVIAKMIRANPKCRPVRFLSMDMAPPEEIALSSLANVPLETQKMNLFSHAIVDLFNPLLHVTGDIRDPLPIPDNKVSLMTVYDAYPFWASASIRGAAERRRFRTQTTDMLEHFCHKLTFGGGQLVVFPWALDRNVRRPQVLLDGIADDLSDRINQRVDYGRFHKNLLRRWMSPGDQHISTGLSPILETAGNSVSALIVNRQRESLVKRGERDREAARKAGELVMQDQSQD